MSFSYSMAISIAYLAAGVFIFLLGLTILRLGGSSTPTRATALILFFAGLGPILSAISMILQANLREGSIVFKTMVENFEYLWEFYFPAILLFSLSFPKEKWLLRKFPVMGFLIFAPYIFHLAMMIFGDNILQGISAIYKGDPLRGDLPIGSDDFSLSGVSKLLSVVILGLVQAHRILFSLVNIVYSALAITILIGSLKAVLNPRISRQLKTVVAGLFVSVTAYSLTKIISYLFRESVSQDVSQALINLSLITGGGTVAFVVVRQQFLGIRHVIRRSILYSGVAIVFAALYLMVVKPVSDYYGKYSMASKEAIETGVIILAIFALQPAMARFEEVLGRLLLKGKGDARAKFRDLGGEITNVTNVKELEGVLQRGFKDILDSSTVNLSLNGHRDTKKQFMGLLEEIGEPVLKPELYRISEKKRGTGVKEGGLFRRSARKQQLALPETTIDPLVELGDQDFEVFVPILKEKRCVGFIGLGEKIYGVNYTHEELGHLSVLSNQVGVAVDNIRLLAENVERKVLEEELKMARRVQRQLLPRESPAINGYDLCGLAVPSRQMAGDYYDFIQIGETELALVVADVSGKGMPAAILTATLHAAIRSNEDVQGDPTGMMCRINSLLYRSTSAEEFATLFYGVIDLETGNLRYANAGHEFPFLLGPDGAFNLGESGIILGCLEQFAYTESSCSIPRDSSLVLFTDGLTDSESPQGLNFGSDRLKRTLEMNTRKSSKEICSIVLDEIKEFSRKGAGIDDMTLIVLKRI